MNEPLLRAEDVAKIFNVKTVTIYEWARINFIPNIRIGACVRFERDAVKKWLDTKRKEGRTRRIPE